MAAVFPCGARLAVRVEGLTGVSHYVDKVPCGGRPCLGQRKMHFVLRLSRRMSGGTQC